VPTGILESSRGQVSSKVNRKKESSRPTRKVLAFRWLQTYWSASQSSAGPGSDCDPRLYAAWIDDADCLGDRHGAVAGVLSTAISPPALVWAMAPAKDRRGALSVQGLLSLPDPEMNDQVFWACAGMA
jgi:hypothetical protein